MERPAIKQPEKNIMNQSIFHGFYLKLKSDKASPVRKAIETFVKTKLPKLIRDGCEREEQGIQVQELMSEMEEKLNEIFPPVVSNGNYEDSETALNGEGIENCVMKNLYQDLFKHSGEEEFNKKYV